jgi:hypothetical protein
MEVYSLEKLKCSDPRGAADILEMKDYLDYVYQLSSVIFFAFIFLFLSNILDFAVALAENKELLLSSCHLIIPLNQAIKAEARLNLDILDEK